MKGFVAALFDLDDTLIVERASAEKAFLAAGQLAHRRAGVDPSSLVQDVKTTARQLWHASPARDYCMRIGISSWEGLWSRFLGDDPSLARLRNWAPAYRQESWLHALKSCGCQDRGLALDLAECFIARRKKLHDVFSDVRPCLTDLRRRLRLGLVTNGASDMQREKLRGSGLADEFEAIVVSGEVGFGKPDSRIFETILAQLRVVACEAVMIGDSLQRDVLGAQQAGLRGVWLNREGKSAPSSVAAPNAVITTLEDLPQALERVAC